MLPFPVGYDDKKSSLPLEGKYSKNEEDCKPFFMISAKLKSERRASSLYNRHEGIARAAATEKRLTTRDTNYTDFHELLNWATKTNLQENGVDYIL